MTAATAVARAKTRTGPRRAKALDQMIHEPTLIGAIAVAVGDCDDFGCRPQIIDVPALGLFQPQMAGDTGAGGDVGAADVSVQPRGTENSPSAPTETCVDDGSRIHKM